MLRISGSSLCILLLGCTIPWHSYADDWPAHPLPTRGEDVAAYGRAIKLRESLDKCLKDAAGTTPGIRDCMNSEHAYQDKRLNTAYKQLMALLNDGNRISLRDEERRWISFRDKFCAPDDSGQGQELETDECLVDQTADRATQLEERLNQQHSPK